MPSFLKPIQAVKCPDTNHLVPTTECADCKCRIEIRDPWRHYAVKCKVGDNKEASYP